MTGPSFSVETKQSLALSAVQANATLNQVPSQPAQACVNLRRTQMISPSWLGDELAGEEGDYASVDQRVTSIGNADSFWLDGHFKEALSAIDGEDPTRIYLSSYRKVLHGSVCTLA